MESMQSIKQSTERGLSRHVKPFLMAFLKKWMIKLINLLIKMYYHLIIIAILIVLT